MFLTISVLLLHWQISWYANRFHPFTAHTSLCVSPIHTYSISMFDFDNTLPYTATMLQMYASTTHITWLLIILELVVHVWPHSTQLASTNFPCPDGMELWNPSMWTLGLHYPDKSMLKAMLISLDFPTSIMIVWLENVCYIHHGIFVVRRNPDIDARKTTDEIYGCPIFTWAAEIGLHDRVPG